MLINQKTYEMKRILLIVSFVFCVLDMVAQSNYIPQRYIYLWDVTYSMCGFVGTDGGGKEIIDHKKDIFDKVVDLLKKQMNSKMDPNTIIIVCPFRGKEGLLDTFKCRATKEELSLISIKIDDFARKIKTEKKRTNTDVITAIRQAKANFIDSDADNFLVILTDGIQNERLSDGRLTTMADLCNEIKTWENLDEDNIFAYLYYYMLTVDATDYNLKKTLDDTKNVSGVNPGEAFKSLFTLQPAKKISANIKDDKSAILAFKVNERESLPSDVKVFVSVKDDEESVLDIKDEEFAIVNNQIEIPLNFRYPYEELKNKLPEKSMVTLDIKLIEEERHNAIIRLAAESTILELINKPEKTLTVRIKR